MMARYKPCPDCDGGGLVDCWLCGGSGKDDVLWDDCEECLGDGTEECCTCEGAGGWLE